MQNSRLLLIKMAKKYYKIKVFCIDYSMNNVLKRVLYIILPIVMVAVLGSIFVNIGMEWFNLLAKPSQWIPNIVIPIVWTVIYVTFAIVLWNWTNTEKLKRSTIALLVVNGVLNVLWCLIFFTLKQTFGGNIIIVLNLIFAVLLWINIFIQKKVYSYFLSIYPIWVSVATTLNMALWILN